MDEPSDAEAIEELLAACEILIILGPWHCERSKEKHACDESYWQRSPQA